jgi:hypothetical protein
MDAEIGSYQEDRDPANPAEPPSFAEMEEAER